MYPSQSTAMSGERGAFWFGVNQPGAVRICATQGKSFIRRLQQRLRDTWNIPSMPTHGVWDRNVGDGLAAVARSLGSGGQYSLPDAQGDTTPYLDPTWGGLSDALLAESRAGVVSNEAVRLGIWIAYLNGTPNGPETVALPPGAILPGWARDPGDDAASVVPGYAATCATQTDLDAALAQGRPVTSVPATTTPTPPSAGGTGVGTPTTFAPSLGSAPGGINWLAIAGFALAVVAVVVATHEHPALDVHHPARPRQAA